MARTLADKKVVVDPTLIAMHTKFFGNDSRWLHNPANKLLPSWLAGEWRTGNFTTDWTDQQYAVAQKSWPKLLALVKLLFVNGVSLTVGTDTPTAWIVPGASIHDEMELLADAGISPEEILQMATRNAYSALGSKSAGRIEPGAKADLLILSENPLEDIRKTRTIELVVSRGVPHEPEQLLQ